MSAVAAHNRGSRVISRSIDADHGGEAAVRSYESGLAAGRAAERAAIVAWLLGRETALDAVADEIETGAHEARKGGG